MWVTLGWGGAEGIQLKTGRALCNSIICGGICKLNRPFVAAVGKLKSQLQVFGVCRAFCSTCATFCITSKLQLVFHIHLKTEKR